MIMCCTLTSLFADKNALLVRGYCSNVIKVYRIQKIRVSVLIRMYIHQISKKHKRLQVHERSNKEDKVT